MKRAAAFVAAFCGGAIVGTAAFALLGIYTVTKEARDEQEALR